MKLGSTLLAFALACAIGMPNAVAAEGDLVITEVMANSHTIPDSDGEWFEVYNATDTDIDLDGYTLYDEDFDMTTVMGSVIVPAGGYALLCINGDPALNGGLACDYDYADNYYLGNSGDEIYIADAAGELVTFMTYSGSDAGNPFALMCVTLDDGDRDNYDIYYGQYYDPNNQGTPGFRNDLVADTDGDGIGDTCDPCPNDAANGCYQLQAGDLVVNELLPNPTAVSDSDGEWFEIYNTTGMELNLRGLTVADDDFDSFVVDADVIIAPYGYALFATSGDPAINGGLPWVDYVYDPYPVYALGNGGDEIVLKWGNTLIDRVEYSGSLETSGVALARVCTTNTMLTRYYDSSYNGVDTGTPGMANGMACMMYLEQRYAECITDALADVYALMDGAPKKSAKRLAYAAKRLEYALLQLANEKPYKKYKAIENVRKAIKELYKAGKYDDRPCDDDGGGVIEAKKYDWDNGSCIAQIINSLVECTFAFVGEGLADAAAQWGWSKYLDKAWKEYDKAVAKWEGGYKYKPEKVVEYLRKAAQKALKALK